MLLPEAIIGVLAVALLYLVLARRLGGWAGVAGALALAVFPSFVAVSRTNNVDALLILLMILACEAALRACERGRWRCALVQRRARRPGFQHEDARRVLDRAADRARLPALRARVAAPPRGAAARSRRRAARRVRSPGSLVVELTPASQRPFVGSSTDNTELGLTFSYNGFGRVGGQTGGPGQIPVGAGGVAKRVAPGKGGAAKPSPVRTVKAPNAPPVFLANGRERNPIAFGEGVGPLRLFERGLGDQGGVDAAVRARRAARPRAARADARAPRRRAWRRPRLRSCRAVASRGAAARAP